MHRKPSVCWSRIRGTAAKYQGAVSSLSPSRSMGACRLRKTGACSAIHRRSMGKRSSRGAGDRLLDAALAGAGPLEGHDHRAPFLREHQGVDPVGAVVCPDGLQHAPQGCVQRPGGEHAGHAVQRHILFPAPKEGVPAPPRGSRTRGPPGPGGAAASSPSPRPPGRRPPCPPPRSTRSHTPAPPGRACRCKPPPRPAPAARPR